MQSDTRWRWVIGHNELGWYVWDATHQPDYLAKGCPTAETAVTEAGLTAMIRRTSLDQLTLTIPAEDPRVKAGIEAAHPDKPQGIAALLDPRCECGHTASDHVGRTGPCRRTPCGVKCRCDVMTVKV